MSVLFRLDGVVVVGRHALLISTDTYSDPAFKRLRAPKTDADALAGVLRDPRIGEYRVRALHNAPVHTVRLAIDELCTGACGDDQILLYVSGHGVKDDSGKLYFVMTDSRPDLLRASAIDAHFVRDLMDNSRSRRIVVWLDCCCAGAFPAGMRPRTGGKVDVFAQLGGRGTVVMTASSALEYAFEVGDGPNTMTGSPGPSVFTGILVDGLRTGGADRDGDGLIDAEELYEYVYNHVTSQPVPGLARQTPTLNSKVEGKLFVARSVRGRRGEHVLPVEIVQALNNPLSVVRGAVIDKLLELGGSGDRRTGAAAHGELTRLSQDPCPKVAEAASIALSRLNRMQAGQPALVTPVVVVSPEPSGTAEPVDSAPETGRIARWRTVLPARRRRTTLIVTAAVAVVVVATVMVLVTGGSPDRAPAADPPEPGFSQPSAATFQVRSGQAASVAFSPDGRLIAVGGDNGSLTLWNREIGQPVRTWTTTGADGLDFSPNGNLLLTEGLNQAQVWRTDTGTLVASLRMPAGDGAYGTAFSADSAMVAIGGTGEVILWDVAHDRRAADLRTGQNYVDGVAFSPDGGTLATTGADASVQLWNLGDDRMITYLPGHTQAVPTVVFSPDGRTLATGSVDGTVRLWDVGTGQPTGTLPGCANPVQTLVFSVDSRSLAAGCVSGAAIWDVATQHSLGRVDPGSGNVYAVAFSPDLKVFAVGGDRGTVTVYDIH